MMTTNTMESGNKMESRRRRLSRLCAGVRPRACRPRDWECLCLVYVCVVLYCCMCLCVYLVLIMVAQEFPCHLCPYRAIPRFCCGYCATPQGLLDWVEADLLRSPSFLTQRVICVMSICIVSFIFSTILTLPVSSMRSTYIHISL